MSPIFLLNTIRGNKTSIIIPIAFDRISLFKEINMFAPITALIILINDKGKI